jgi:hypothetical protein
MFHHFRTNSELEYSVGLQSVKTEEKYNLSTYHHHKSENKPLNEFHSTTRMHLLTLSGGIISSKSETKCG